MTEDWLDPFNQSDADRDREERRLAREERRRARLAKRVKQEPEPPAEPEAREVPVEDASVAPGPEPPPEVETGAGMATIPPEDTPKPQSAWGPRRPPRGPAEPPRSRHRARRIALALIAVAALVAGVFAVLLYQPFHGAGSGRVEVTIPKGASASDISDLLDKKGVVSNSTFFHLRLSLSGKASQIQAGKYALRSDMSYGDAIDTLATPPKPIKPKVITVTIPEGYDRVQTAALLKKDGVKGDYEKATESYKGFDPKKYGAKAPANLEGFLFPATYKLKPGQGVTDLVGEQLAAFKQTIAGVNMKYARSKNLTPYDVVTIASIIEREAQKAADRPKVAAVVYNRLHASMPLQIDATIRFAENNYTKPLTQSDLQLNSPYNSYTNPGLPPGPISNPGLASIQAAARPAKVSYIYYLTKPGACGKLQFATTLAEQQRNQAAYDNARNAAGGKSPTTC